MGKCFSEIERMYIKKTVKSEGTCVFTNSFVLGASILTGTDYNNNLLGVYTPEQIKKEWEDEPSVIRETLENQHRAIDWNSFIWFFDHQEHEECLEFYGQVYDFMENEIPLIALDDLDELLDIIEEYYYKYRDYYMPKIKSVEMTEDTNENKIEFE